MLKKRVIPILLYSNDRLYKTIKFDNARDVGFPATAVRVYESQEADEIVFLNISKDLISFNQTVSWVRKLSQEFCAPLTVGGGIRSFDQVQMLFDNGADKVLLNTINYTDLTILNKTASVYGAQAAVAGMDTRKESNIYNLYSAFGTNKENICFSDHVARCEQNGAGEFFVQSIDLDGSMQGLDVELGKLSSSLTNKPIILAGGIGSYSHLEVAFQQSNISGIGCASIFHFSDSSPLRACAFLANAGIHVKKV